MTELTDPTTTADRDDRVRPRPYKVARVEKTDSPQGSDGQNWYRYVLDNGRSTVVGQRQGSLKDVQAYATHCAEQLNARGLHGRSTWVPRGRKPASTA
jgi:hypothetical protein